MRAEYPSYFITAEGTALPTGETVQESVSRQGKDAKGNVIPVVFLDKGQPTEEIYKKLFESIPYILSSNSKANSEPDVFAQHSDYYGRTINDIKSGLVTIATDSQAKSKDNGVITKYTRTVRPSQLPSVSKGESTIITTYPMSIGSNPTDTLSVVEAGTERSDYTVKLSDSFLNWLDSAFDSVKSYIDSNTFNSSFFTNATTGEVKLATASNKLSDDIFTTSNQYYGTNSSGVKGVHTLSTGTTLPTIVNSRYLNTSSSGDLQWVSLTQADITGLTTSSSPTFAGLTLNGSASVTGNITVSGTVDGVDVSTLNTNYTTHTTTSNGVHGVTGNIVGTSDTQTLTNKILGTTTVQSGSTMTMDNVGITTGTTGLIIGASSSNKLGFYGAAATVSPSPTEFTSDAIALTQVGSPSSFDTTITALTSSTPFGFANADEGESFIKTTLETRDRVKMILDRLIELGLYTVSV